MAETGFEPDEDDRRLQAGLEALVESGVLEPLSTTQRDVRLFMDCDLASLVENLCFETADPRTFTDARREAYEALIAQGRFRLTNPLCETWHRRVFFLLDDGKRAGSLALSSRFFGSALVSVSSLYVFPDHRGRGVAARALRHARQVLCAYGARGLRVPTCWTWQPAVRFYLAQRLWVCGFKDDVVFIAGNHLPDWFVDLSGDDACFGIVRDARRETWITARRRAERLDWREQPALAVERNRDPEVSSYAPGTFAVALAEHEWLPRRCCEEPDVFREFPDVSPLSPEARNFE